MDKESAESPNFPSERLFTFPSSFIRWYLGSRKTYPSWSWAKESLRPHAYPHTDFQWRKPGEGLGYGRNLHMCLLPKVLNRKWYQLHFTLGFSSYLTACHIWNHGIKRGNQDIWVSSYTSPTPGLVIRVGRLPYLPLWRTFFMTYSDFSISLVSRKYL